MKDFFEVLKNYRMYRLQEKGVIEFAVYDPILWRSLLIKIWLASIAIYTHGYIKTDGADYGQFGQGRARLNLAVACALPSLHPCKRRAGLPAQIHRHRHGPAVECYPPNHDGGGIQHGFHLHYPARFSMAGIQDVSFVVFLCSGLLPWLSFVDGLNRATSCFVDNASYLRKLPIPEEVFLAKTVVGSSILLGINLLALAITALGFGLMPSVTWLFVPLTGALMMVLAFGLGALLGTVNVFVRDVSQIVTITTQLWMWLTPIVYSSQAMPAGLWSLQYANPIYPFIELIREQFLFGRIGAPQLWLLALMWAAVALIAGTSMLKYFRSELRDVL